MSEIAKRLRKAASLKPNDELLIREAADEIARLERNCDSLRLELQGLEQTRLHDNAELIRQRDEARLDKTAIRSAFGHAARKEELPGGRWPMEALEIWQEHRAALHQLDEARQKLREAQEDINALQGDLNEIATQFGIELLGVGLRAKLHGLALGMRGKLDEARRELARTREMLKQVLMDWVHSYAPQECHESNVALTRERIRNAGGTLVYIASINEELRAALAEGGENGEA